MHGFLFTILAFGVLNLALYFGQEWYHSADENRCIILEKEIDAQKRQFISLEFQLNNLVEKLDKTTSEKEWDQLHEKYVPLREKYDRIFDSHNSNVENYNKLIKRCGSRWYVIPMPGRGRSTAHT